EAKPLSLLAAYAAPGVKQLRSAALADDPRQDGAGPHVAAAKTDAVEQERNFRGQGSDADIGGHGDDRARAGANAVDRRNDRLRTGAHRLDHVAGHPGEVEELDGAHLGE